MTKLEGPGMQQTIVYFVNTSLVKKWYQKLTVRIVMYLFTIPCIQKIFGKYFIILQRHLFHCRYHHSVVVVGF